MKNTFTKTEIQKLSQFLESISTTPIHVSHLNQIIDVSNASDCGNGMSRCQITSLSPVMAFGALTDINPAWHKIQIIHTGLCDIAASLDNICEYPLGAVIQESEDDAYNNDHEFPIHLEIYCNNNSILKLEIESLIDVNDTVYQDFKRLLKLYMPYSTVLEKSKNSNVSNSLNKRFVVNGVGQQFVLDKSIALDDELLTLEQACYSLSYEAMNSDSLIYKTALKTETIAEPISIMNKDGELVLNFPDVNVFTPFSEIKAATISDFVAYAKR